MIVLAGRNLAKMEAAKAELDELDVESYLCKTDIADRAQVQALADFAASLGDVTQVIHTSGVSPSDTATENIIRIKRTVHSSKDIPIDNISIPGIQLLKSRDIPLLYITYNFNIRFFQHDLDFKDKYPNV